MNNIFNKLKRKYIKRKRKKRRGAGARSRSKYSQKRTVSKKKFVNIVILLIIALFGTGFIWWGGSTFLKFNSLKLSTSLRDKVQAGRPEWKAQKRLNILVVGKDSREGEFGYSDLLMVVMIDPSEDSVGVFNINPDILVLQEYYNRKVKLRNVYNLGVLDKNVVPINLVLTEVESLLSIRLNRYIIVDEEGLVNIANNLNGIYVNNQTDLADSDIAGFKLNKGSARLTGKDYLSFIRTDDDGNEQKFTRQIEAMQGILKRSVSYTSFLKAKTLLDLLEKEVETNIDKNELIRISYELANMKQVRTGFIKAQSLRKNIDDEGEVSFIPIYEEIDKDIQKVFVDRNVGLEQARVEVFNSTDVTGLATFRARWLKNIGIDVIRIGDIGEVHEKTTIYVQERDAYEQTVSAIQRSFKEEIKIVWEDTPDIICTGDVIVILGENVKEFY